MMMKSVFWWRKPEHPEETTDLRQVTDETFSHIRPLPIYGLWQAKMAQFFSTIGRHLECAIQTELVVELELALIERKQCRRFRHNSIICQKDTKGVA